MAQMSIAAGAQNFDTLHEVTIVGCFLNVLLGDRFPEAGPASA
jgi:hypothetical protein